MERLASRVGHQQADQEARIAALKAAAEVEGSYVRTCRDVENGEKQRQELDNSLNTGQGFVTAQQLQQQQHFQQLGAQQHLQHLAIQQQQLNQQLGAQQQLRQQHLANQQQHHFQQLLLRPQVQPRLHLPPGGLPPLPQPPFGANLHQLSELFPPAPLQAPLQAAPQAPPQAQERSPQEIVLLEKELELQKELVAVSREKATTRDREAYVTLLERELRLQTHLTRLLKHKEAVKEAGRQEEARRRLEAMELQQQEHARRAELTRMEEHLKVVELRRLEQLRRLGEQEEQRRFEARRVEEMEQVRRKELEEAEQLRRNQEEQQEMLRRRQEEQEMARKHDEEVKSSREKAWKEEEKKKTEDSSVNLGKPAIEREGGFKSLLKENKPNDIKAAAKASSKSSKSIIDVTGNSTFEFYNSDDEPSTLEVQRPDVSLGVGELLAPRGQEREELVAPRRQEKGGLLAPKEEQAKAGDAAGLDNCGVLAQQEMILAQIRRDREKREEEERLSRELVAELSREARAGQGPAPAAVFPSLDVRPVQAAAAPQARIAALKAAAEVRGTFVRGGEQREQRSQEEQRTRRQEEEQRERRRQEAEKQHVDGEREVRAQVEKGAAWGVVGVEEEGAAAPKVRSLADTMTVVEKKKHAEKTKKKVLEKEEKKVRARRNSEVMAEMDHERRLAGELVRERQRAQVSSSPPWCRRGRRGRGQRARRGRRWPGSGRRRTGGGRWPRGAPPWRWPAWGSLRLAGGPPLGL